MENNPKNKRKKSNRPNRAEANSTSSEPIRHLHDGHVYHLPIPVKSSGILFSDLLLTFIKVGKFATVSLTSSQHEFVAPLSDDNYQAVVTLKGIDRTNENSLVSNPVVYVYRKGTPIPLYSSEMSFDRDNYTATLRQAELGTGDYFILISGAEESMSCYCEMEDMEGMATFHFSIKPHGSRLLHPNLRHWLDDELPLLHLVSTDDVLNVREEYRYVCYNQVYRFIYKHTCAVVEGCLTLSLMDSSSPLDDIYTVILYHNNEPIMAYRYTLLEKKVYHLTAIEIKGMSPLYALATMVSHHIYEVEFALEPGFLPVKNYILDVLSETKSKGNLMIFCSVLPSQDFVKSMMEILHGQDCYAILDGQELAVKQGNLQRYMKKEAIVIQNLSVLLHPDNHDLLNSLDMFMSSGNRTFYLIDLADTLMQFMKRLDLSVCSFTDDHRLLVPDYEPADVVFMVDAALMEFMYRMDGTSQTRLNELVMRKEELFASLNREALTNWVKNSIVPYLKGIYDDDDDDQCDWTAVYINFDAVGLPETSDKAYEKCLAELHAMVGLENLKSRLMSLFNRTKFDCMRRNMGLPALNENRYHMIFTGNPGTGKTTVARIMGKVFKELGILSIGEVITVERADMVGKYIGHTEDTMKELLERSKGNVLFIDEAYSLCDSSRSDRTDYGYRVIECLLGVLAKNDSDIIIIMAGYGEEMKQMLSKNPGLRGRFVYTFNFEDYTSDQLLTISLNKLQEKCFRVDDSAKEVMKSCIARTVATKNALFHNARWAEQFAMQGIVSAMADRICIANEQPNIQDLCMVTINDVLTGYEISRPSGNSDRRPVGFRNG